ncbi:MAG: hypothetical protein ABI220_00425 [Candidatus Saccharimonadales bacterium]
MPIFRNSDLSQASRSSILPHFLERAQRILSPRSWGFRLFGALAFAGALTATGIYTTGNQTAQATDNSASPLTLESSKQSQNHNTSTISASQSSTSHSGGNSNKLNTSTNLTTSAEPGANNSVQTSLEVNGQPVDIPSNGSVHRTIQNSDGVTTLDISSSSSGQSSGNSSSSSLNVDISSSSQTSPATNPDNGVNRETGL